MKARGKSGVRLYLKSSSGPQGKRAELSLHCLGNLRPHRALPSHPRSFPVWWARWHVSRGADKKIRNCAVLSSISSKAGSKNAMGSTPVPGGKTGYFTGSPKLYKRGDPNWVCSSPTVGLLKAVLLASIQWQTVWEASNTNVGEEKWDLERKEGSPYREFCWISYCCEQLELGSAG